MNGLRLPRICSTNFWTLGDYIERLSVGCDLYPAASVFCINLALLDDFVLNFDVAIGGAACAMIHILRPCFLIPKPLIVDET